MIFIPPNLDYKMIRYVKEISFFDLNINYDLLFEMGINYHNYGKYTFQH